MKWNVISREWFNGKISSTDCKAMWENSGSIVHHISSSRSAMTQISNTRITKPKRNMSSFKRRNEEEAIEMKKLFAMKSRNEEEMNILYRAYIVGCDHLDKVLRMNVPRRDEYLRISLPSIIVAMKNLGCESVSGCKMSISKLIRKLPRAVLDMPMDNLVSPLRFDTNHLHDHQRFLSFNSTMLPVQDVIMNEIIHDDDESMDDMTTAYSSEDDMLMRLASSQMYVLPLIL